MIAMVGVLMMGALQIPAGETPEPLEFSHFPDRLHAFVWRNWSLVPIERMAQVVGATPEQLTEIGHSMGLEGPPTISKNQESRSYITVIRRNWHLLPYDQLEQLLDLSEEELAYILREDDFLWIKLGGLKPKCDRLTYAPPSEEAKARCAEIAATIREAFPKGLTNTQEPLFGFVEELSRPPAGKRAAKRESTAPRYCYSYFATYGDPLLDTDLDPLPDGLLARLSDAGVNGVWMQAVLYKLAPFPWDESLSEGYEERLKNLRAQVERAGRQGIGIYLYLNEPRSMPVSFYEAHPELKGVVENDFAALCSEAPEVQEYLRRSVALIAKEVPDLAGFFTISGSENLTNCWSHYQGAQCPRCGQKEPAQVIANLHRAFREAIDEAGSDARLIAWDWGWKDEWIEGIVERLPKNVTWMSVSEWSLPIVRGGVESAVGEYSISAVGPGPRATRHWGLARERGLEIFAKVQAGNTWELSSVPYIPAVANVAQHAANLREAHVNGIMLGWTLGGYPSPNLEVFGEISGDPSVTPDEAMLRTATRRFGAEAAPTVVEAWKTMSRSFQEFPYHIGTVYTAPLQQGPSNLLWAQPTGYRATMVGIPYDDLTSWRSIYPSEVFIAQLRKTAEGFDRAVEELRKLPAGDALEDEIGVAEAAAVTFRSVANQSEFVEARQALLAGDKGRRERMRELIRDELENAKRMHAIQSRDSRIGFEATNHYNYIAVDFGEKVLNCVELLREY